VVISSYHEGFQLNGNCKNGYKMPSFDRLQSKAVEVKAIYFIFQNDIRTPGLFSLPIYVYALMR
jgi:hypothetical protein